ncbi:mitochondrial ribosomal protein 10 [Poronia punctata]|nr:mitochondrial ribosomal protein 10 [Poronia punctata]
MSQKPIRLPPLKVLRVRNPNAKPERPCVSMMSNVLTCWASAGYSTAGCAQVEEALRACMDGPPTNPPRKNTINYNLTRFQDRLTQTQKRRK